MKLIRRAGLLAAMLPSACAVSPAPTLLTLERPPYAGPATAITLPLVVGPVSIPDAVDRMQVMRLVENNRLEALPAARWAQPLRTEIATALAAHLAQALDNPRTQTAGLTQPVGQHRRLAIDLLRLDLRAGNELSIELLWVLSAGPGSKELASRRISLTEKLNGTDAGAIAAAHSRAVARMATEIAAVMRALPN